MRKNETLELLDHQYDVLTASEKFINMVGGIGSGKSFTGACNTINMVKLNPYSTGFIGANSYKQLHDATLHTTFTLLDSLKIPFTYKQSKGHLIIGTKLFLCRTMDNYDDFRGFEISDYWVDEIGYAKKEAVQTLRGRMRHPASKVFRGLGTTSPCGFNWLWDESINNPLKNMRLIRAKTKDNIHLPDDYEETLRSTYDAKMIAQELDGDFVNLNALPTYYSFSRLVNVDSTIMYDPNRAVYIAMDFNVNPMTAVLFQLTDNGEMLVFDEAFLPNSNTYQMADHLIQKGFHGCPIIPDATGRALKTSAEHGFSDFVILRNKGFQILDNGSNPHVADRYLCVNGLLHMAKLRIHPRCVKLINDFEQHSRDGSHGPEISHISDACGYGAWRFFPLVAKRPTIKQYSY